MEYCFFSENIFRIIMSFKLKIVINKWNLNLNFLNINVIFSKVKLTMLIPHYH